MHSLIPFPFVVDCSECAVEGECFAITFDSPDPVFGGKSCLDFTRAHHETDSNGVRQQLNSITTWLDASFVYGSSDMTADTLTDGKTVPSFYARHLSFCEANF